MDTDEGWDDSQPSAEGTADEAQPSAEGAAAGTADEAFAGAPIVDGPLALDESRPYGRMQNQPGAHYIQDGNLFGVDKKFIGTQQEIQ